MINIKFNNAAVLHSCKFSRYAEHIVTLSGITEQNRSGFCTYRLSGEPLGDFYDYTTVYRVLDNAVQYSNDGSVYIEPDPEPAPNPDPTPSDIDRIAAQVLYTAIMTDTLLEENNDA